MNGVQAEVASPFLVAGLITAGLAVVVFVVEFATYLGNKRAAKIRAEEAPAIERATREGAANG